MRYNISLLSAATIFLVSSPVVAAVKDGLSAVNEEVKIAQVQGKKQLRDEALRLNKLGLQQLSRAC